MITSDDINKLLLEEHDLCKLYAVISYTYTTFYHLAHCLPYTYKEKYNLHSLCKLYVVDSLSYEYNTSLCGVYHLLSTYVFIVYRTYVINVLYGNITVCLKKIVLSLYGELCILVDTLAKYNVKISLICIQEAIKCRYQPP